MLVGYTMIGTNDHAKAMSLYAPVMAILGAKKIDAYSTETRTWFGRDGSGMLAIGGTANGEPATGGNGTMLGLTATDPAMIDAAHAKAIELGATDEGAPGLRGPNMYFAYFRDFDGNKIAMFAMIKT
jgi:catechol 2,3-dioxygenase-like lactoylglutathione lyase family enzyme